MPRNPIRMRDVIAVTSWRATDGTPFAARPDAEKYQVRLDLGRVLSECVPESGWTAEQILDFLVSNAREVADLLLGIPDAD